jgi:hypothetical protein
MAHHTKADLILSSQSVVSDKDSADPDETQADTDIERWRMRSLADVNRRRIGLDKDKGL